MTDSAQAEYIAQLEARITRLEAQTPLLNALLRIEWNRRGQAKGEASKIEKELEFEWNSYLNRVKIETGKMA